jgi:sugar lactone lactonase YvrE
MTRRRAPSPPICLLFATFLALHAVPAYAAKGGKGGGGKDRTPPTVTIDSPTDGQSFQSPSATVTGSATDNAAVESAELVVNFATPAPLVLSGDGRYSAPVLLREGDNTITVTAVDTAGMSSAASVTVRFVQSSPAIIITTPSDGDVINAGHVDVTGTFEDPVIGIHGSMPTGADPGTFSIPAYPLAEGETREITITGSDDNGNDHTATISVSSTSAVDPLTLTADTPGGEIPLMVTFSLANNTLETITSCEIDYYGSGEYVSTPDCLDGFTHTYEKQGLVAPSVRVVTAENHSFSGYTVISPYDRAEHIASFPAAEPIDLEVDRDGRLYILERAEARVVVTDADGAALAAIGGLGTGDGFFMEPTGIGLDHDGNLYVADAATDKVQVFNASFQHTATWGRSGTRRGEMSDVRGIGIEYDGRILVADAANGRVDEYRPHGYFVKDIGKGIMTSPRDVVWTGGGRFAVSDSGTGEVNLHSTGRVTPYTWGTPLPPLGEPSGLGYDLKNNWLLIADEGKNRITVVMDSRQSGTFVRHIDDLAGDDIGLSNPTAVAWLRHPVDNVYFIADTGNNRVVKVKLSADGGSTPVEAWTGVREALAAGDIDGAVSYFLPRTQEIYRDLFTTAGERLPVIVQDMGDIHPLSAGGNRAVYGALRYDNDKPFLFEVVFVRDGTGEWKILQW